MLFKEEIKLTSLSVTEIEVGVWGKGRRMRMRMMVLDGIVSEMVMWC